MPGAVSTGEVLMRKNGPLALCLLWLLAIFFGYGAEALGGCQGGCLTDLKAVTIGGGGTASACEHGDPNFHISASMQIKACTNYMDTYEGFEVKDEYGTDVPHNTHLVSGGIDEECRRNPCNLTFDITIPKSAFPQGGKVLVGGSAGCIYEACHDWCDAETVIFTDATPKEVCDGIDNNCNGLVDEIGCTCENKVGSPVNIFTGEMDHSVKLFDFSSPGINLGFSINYKTGSSMTKSIGTSHFAGWRHNYEFELRSGEILASDYFKLYYENDLVPPMIKYKQYGDYYIPFVYQETFKKGDGKALVFYESSDGINYFPTKGNKASLQRQVNGGYLLLDDDGLEYYFDNKKRIISIRDTNCNWIQYNYSGTLSYPNSVTNNYNQTIRFTYSGKTLSKVIDMAGHEYNFQYSGANLSKLTLPDDDSNPDNNPSYVFAYGHTAYNCSLAYMTQLIDPLGRKTNWGYDGNHRAVSSSMEGGAGKVNIAYQSDGLGTKVTDSKGNIKEYKIEVEPSSRTQKMTVTGGGCSSCSGQGNDTEYDYITGEIRNTIDQNGNKTVYEDYDAHGRAQRVIEAANTANQRVTDYEYHQILGTPIKIQKDSILQTGQKKITVYDYDDPNSPGNNPNVPNEAPTPYLYKVIEKGFTADPSDPGTPKSYMYITSYDYNAAHQLILMDGPRTDVNDVTIYEYYLNETWEGFNRGRLKSTTDGLGHQTVYSDYDAYGNIGKITDPNGLVTTFSYNARNKLSQMTVILSGSEGSRVTRYFYDPAGNLDYIVLPKGNVINYGYDVADRMTSITRRIGPNASSTAIDSITYSYDTEGNRTGEFYRIGDKTGTITKQTEFTYDQYNKLAQILNPGGSHQDFLYDPNGNRVGLSDENSNQTSYSYDSLNHLIKVSQPETLNIKPETNYSYDPLDNLQTVTDAKSQSTQYTYDDLGRLVKAVSPDTGTTYYFYDEAGNLIKKKDAKSQETTYSYDDLNRLLAIIPPPPVGGGGGEGVNYTYDQVQIGGELTNGKGRLTTITDASGTTNLFYDLRGNVIKEQKTAGGFSFTTSYSYDANGNLLGVIYPGGRGFIYNFNSIDADRVTSISGTINGVSSTLASNISYVPYGGISSITYGNGVQTTITRDLRYQIISLTTQPLGYPTTPRLLDFTYSYDNVGNITGIVDNMTPSKSRAFTYDSLNRLETGAGVWGSLGWSYDGVGNRGTQAGSEETISYNFISGTNKLESESISRGSLNYARGYTHDANGNITQVTFPRIVTDYVFNADNRLVEVKENNVTVATYIYDYQGRRIKKTAGGVETIYLYDLYGNLIYEYNKTANKTNEHVYLGSERIARIDNSNPVISLVPWYDQPKKRTMYAGGFAFGFAIISLFGIVYLKNGNKKYLLVFVLGLGCLGTAGVLGFLVLPTTAHGQGSDDTVYYYHNDHLGSPIKMTDSDGTVAWAADYLPFGQVQIDPASTITNNFRFPGQYYDEETRLNYNWNRYYVAALGRYLSPDPIAYVLYFFENIKNDNIQLISKKIGLNMNSYSKSLNNFFFIPFLLRNPNDLNLFIYGANNSVIFSDFRGFKENKADPECYATCLVQFAIFCHILCDPLVECLLNFALCHTACHYAAEIHCDNKCKGAH